MAVVDNLNLALSQIDADGNARSLRIDRVVNLKQNFNGFLYLQTIFHLKTNSKFKNLSNAICISFHRRKYYSKVSSFFANTSNAYIAQSKFCYLIFFVIQKCKKLNFFYFKIKLLPVLLHIERWMKSQSRI